MAAHTADSLLRTITPRLARKRGVRLVTVRLLVPSLLALERFMFARDEAHRPL